MAISKAVQLAMIAAGDFYAVDLGNNGKIAVHGKDGPAVMPPVPRKGLNSAERFAENFRVLLCGQAALFDSFPALPMVTEASTPDTCGVEGKILWGIIQSSEFDVFKISCRAVKNYRKDTITPDADGNLPEGTDAEAAKIIYLLARENQDRLSLYKGPDAKSAYVIAEHHTVRPYDKRDYKDPDVEYLMNKNCPPYNMLCPDLKVLLGDGKQYARSRAFPLAQSLDEEMSATRDGWEKLIGLNGNGRKCHYRRNVENIRQPVAKILAGVRKNSEVTPEQRKESWILVRRLLREFYHLAQGTLGPVKGTRHPISGGSGSRILADLKEKRGFTEEDLFSEE